MYRNIDREIEEREVYLKAFGDDMMVWHGTVSEVGTLYVLMFFNLPIGTYIVLGPYIFTHQDFILSVMGRMSLLEMTKTMKTVHGFTLNWQPKSSSKWQAKMYRFLTVSYFLYHFCTLFLCSVFFVFFYKSLKGFRASFYNLEINVKKRVLALHKLFHF